ncbi:class C beta-lactamase-related serine hydrolase [Rhodovulum sp. 12E13]|uniref:serine hydrolase domain-containing protein n=1 Tax=Rhodovulum sp. 12E13 TaxID=2203891 RepID=UPI000E1B12C8|nr:serine hydrolase [Rhodovulum sp. 12E13]RDC72615.1 class C beta-lactamase-related serine hydrolase [Rhodovulum sp. 12E13]
MKRWLRRAGVVLLALAVMALAGGLWFREELSRLHAVNTLFDEDSIVGNFSAMDSLFLTTPLPRGDGPVTPLPPGTPLVLPAVAEDWIAATDVTGLVVLDRGALVVERARLGTAPDDRRISWSIAKSFLSALFGLSVARGEVALDDPVTDHAPALAGSAYAGVTVRDALTMQSGVTFDEDYLDSRSDINRMGRVIALGGTMDGFAAALEARDRPAGEAWAYVSIDTHVLAMVLRGATGRSLAELMSERLIAPLGLEAEPYFLTDGEGVAFALGGLNLALRDYARFGLMVAQEGRIGGRQVVPEAWIEASTTPQAATAPGALRYGYQWWIPWDGRPGEVLGRGVYGQYLYIDRVRDVVIVATAADRGFRAPGRQAAAMAALRAISDALEARR